MLENLGNNNFNNWLITIILCVAVGVCDVTNKVDKWGRSANWLVGIEPIGLRPEELTKAYLCCRHIDRTTKRSAQMQALAHFLYFRTSLLLRHESFFLFRLFVCFVVVVLPRTSLWGVYSYNIIMSSTITRSHIHSCYPQKKEEKRGE